MCFYLAYHPSCYRTHTSPELWLDVRHPWSPNLDTMKLFYGRLIAFCKDSISNPYYVESEDLAVTRDGEEGMSSRRVIQPRVPCWEMLPMERFSVGVHSRKCPQCEARDEIEGVGEHESEWEEEDEEDEEDECVELALSPESGES